MAMTCRTSDGDLLDVICQNYYGHLIGTVEAVLEANPGLSREPQPYRVGLLINLPVITSTVDSSVTLWD